MSKDSIFAFFAVLGFRVLFRFVLVLILLLVLSYLSGVQEFKSLRLRHSLFAFSGIHLSSFCASQDFRCRNSFGGARWRDRSALLSFASIEKAFAEKNPCRTLSPIVSTTSTQLRLHSGPFTLFRACPAKSRRRRGTKSAKV